MFIKRVKNGKLLFTEWGTLARLGVVLRLHRGGREETALLRRRHDHSRSGPGQCGSWS